MATHSSSGNSHTLVYKNYSQSDKRVPNPMVNYVGVHVLHDNILPDMEISNDDSNDNLIETRKKLRKKRTRRSESAPQEQVQLNGADSQGSVGGSAA